MRVRRQRYVDCLGELVFRSIPRTSPMFNVFPQCYSSIATTPLSSTLLGVALTALIFLTLIGFAQRRTNVIESSLLALYFAYSVWLCSDEHFDDDGHGGYGSEAYWARWVGAGAVA